MQPSHNVIQRLPEAVVQQSRASTHITDISVAVAELVQNAVDAGSRSVNVTSSTKGWSVSVTDDGYGITAASMQLVGQRFCTSKPDPARGEALSCLAQVSSLHITSRAQGAFETYTKAIGTATNTTLQLCTTPRQRHGTTVTLTNFLQSQPVRRRQSKGHAAVLEEVKTALHQVMLPHPAVELLLQQTGSCAVLLHMPKDRTLSSSCRQLFQHVEDHTYCFSTPHKQGWQLTGCVAAPPAVFQSGEHQLLYFNKRPITCNVLQQLLRDWFLRSLRGYQANPDNHSTRNASLRAPEPGYVLLITCPASAVVLQSRTALHAAADFSASMGQLVAQLQEGIGPAWGTMPPAWRAAAAPQHSSRSGGGPLCMGSSHSGGGRHGAAAIIGADSAKVGSGKQRIQLTQQLHVKQAQLQPVHGLHLTSRTRSLAGRAAATQGDCGGYQQHNAMTVQQPRHSNHQEQVERMHCGAADTSDDEFLISALHSSRRHTVVEVAPGAAASATVDDAEGAAAHICNPQDVPAHLPTAHINTAWMGHSSSPAQHAPASVSATGRHPAAAASAVAVAARAGRDFLSSPGLLDSGFCGGEVSANTAAAVIAAAVAAATPKRTAAPGANQSPADWLEDGFCEVQPSVATAAKLPPSSPTIRLTDTLADDMVAVSNPAALFRRSAQQQQRRLRRRTPLQQLQHNAVSTDLSVDRCSISPLDSAGEIPCHAHHSPILQQQQQQQQQQCSWLLADYSRSYSPKPAAATAQAVAAELLEDGHLANTHVGADPGFDCTMPSPESADYYHHFWEGGDMQQRQSLQEHTMLWEVPQQHASCGYELCSPAAIDGNCQQSDQQQPVSRGQSPFGASPLTDHRLHAVAGLDSPNSPGFGTVLDLQELQHRQNPHKGQHAQQQPGYMDFLGRITEQQEPKSMDMLWGLDMWPHQGSTAEESRQQLLKDCNDGRSWHWQQQDDEDPVEQQQYQHVAVAYISRHSRSAVAAGCNFEDQFNGRYDSNTNTAQLLTHNSCQSLQLQRQQDAEPVHVLLNRSMHQSGSAEAVAASPSAKLLQAEDEEELEQLFLHHSWNVAAPQQHQQQQHKASSVATEQDCWGLGAAIPHARTALQQQQQEQEQQQRASGGGLYWYQQHQPATAIGYHTEVLHAIQPLDTEAFDRVTAGDTPPGFAVYSRMPSFGPSPVVSRRCGGGGGVGNEARSLLGGLQQLFASPLDVEHGALQATQAAAAAGQGMEAHVAAQESVGSGLFGQHAVSCRKGATWFNYKGPSRLGYHQQQHSPHEQRHQQQLEHTQLRIGPAQSEETVQQQHEHESEQRDNQQQQWLQHNRNVEAQQQLVGKPPAEVSAGTRRATAAAAAVSAPLLQPFHERLLRSVSPQCKRQRRFAVYDSLAAADNRIAQGHVRQLQLEETDGSMIYPTHTDAAGAVGVSSKARSRLPAPCTQLVAGLQSGAAAQAAAGSGSSEQPFQHVSAANTACRVQESPKGRTALQDISNIHDAAPNVVHMKASPKQRSNPSKADTGIHTTSTAANALKHTAVTAKQVAAGLGAEPSSAWQQMQQLWKHQQHNSSMQKRRKLSADKVGLQEPPSKQWQQSKLPFLPLSSARPAEQTVCEAGSAAGVQGPQLANAQQLRQVKDMPADAVAGAAAAAAVPLPAITTEGTGRASAHVAAAKLGASSASAPNLRSSLSKPKPTAAQLQTSPGCGAIMRQLNKPRKRVRFSDTPLSSPVKNQLGCATAQQQQQQGPFHDPAAVGQCQAEITTVQSAAAAAAAACTKAAAPGARTSPYFNTVQQRKQTSSTTGGCSSLPSAVGATAGSGGLLGSHSLANASCLPPAILSVNDLCRGSSTSSSTALVPDSVTRQQLQHAHLLTQVDNKVIVVRCGSVLLAIDQHAADERVQLEALQHKLALQLQQQDSPQQQQQGRGLGAALPAIPQPADLANASKADAAYGISSSSTSGLSGTTVQPRLLPHGGLLLQPQKLTPGVSMLLSLAETRSLVQYRQQVEAWGWKVLLQDSKDGAAAGQATGVTTAALLQQAPVLCDVQLGALDLQMYLHQLLETCGSAQQPPPGVVRTLKSKACRSAVMFGTALSQQQCVELVQQLGATQLCFCCAHGRPTTAPLVDFVALTARTKQQSAARSLGQAAVAAAEGSHGRTAMQQLMHKLCKLVKCR